MSTTDITNLETRRSAICEELASLTPYSGKDLPNRASQGVNVDYVGYRKSLLEELKQIDEAIKSIRDAEEGSAVYVTETKI